MACFKLDHTCSNWIMVWRFCRPHQNLYPIGMKPIFLNTANKKDQASKTTEHIDRVITAKILANLRQSALKIAYEIQTKFNVKFHPQSMKNRIKPKRIPNFDI